MTQVRFYDAADDRLLKFAVIAARHRGRWVFCRHKARDTFEIPGGHREAGEAIDDTARRELREETGAVDFTLRPVCVYSVSAPDNFGGAETFGMLYAAEISSFEPLRYEIEEILVTDRLPEKWTYPDIQPRLLDAARSFFQRRSAAAF